MADFGEWVWCGPALDARPAPREESENTEVRARGKTATLGPGEPTPSLQQQGKNSGCGCLISEGMLSARNESCLRTYFKVKNSAAEKAKEISGGKWAAGKWAECLYFLLMAWATLPFLKGPCSAADNMDFTTITLTIGMKQKNFTFPLGNSNIFWSWSEALLYYLFLKLF